MVVGLCFSMDGRNVLFIKKQKPEWQKDRLNGPGGKVELGEQAKPSMAREFEEETGLTDLEWRHIVTLRVGAGDDYKEIYIYSSMSDGIFMVKNPEEETTGETLHVVPVEELFNVPVLHNLRWMVPLAMDEQVIFPVEVYARGPSK